MPDRSASLSGIQQQYIGLNLYIINARFELSWLWNSHVNEPKGQLLALGLSLKDKGDLRERQPYAYT